MVDLNRVLKSAIDYCENDPKGYKHCMKVFHDMGLKYTMDVLASAGLLPSECAKEEPSWEEKREWERLTTLAMGEPSMIAENVFNEVMKWCTEHSGDDVLTCLEDHHPWYFGDLAEMYFMPDLPNELRDAILRNIEAEDWDEAEAEYDRLWSNARKELKNFYMDQNA